ncbi:GntR family transcriptional regulator [Mameliella alba]|uniref:GntR family transcriptional regulator n=1 Tax=Mameliella alba TaxID=561184 RepID=UPI0031590285
MSASAGARPERIGVDGMGEQAISKKARRVEDVRRRILTQLFEPGSYLDEAELAQPYYISRPPLREALNQLPAENATEAQVMQLKDTQELFRKAIREGDAAGRALMNQRFHAIIGEMVDNEFLRPSLWRLLIDHTRIGMSFYNPRNRSMAEQRSVAADQHDQFIALIEQGDVEGAGQLALDHWELSRAEIESFVTPLGMQIPLGPAPGTGMRKREK